MRNILITGATGLLGPYLVRAAKPYGKVITTSRHLGDVITDLSVQRQAKELIRISQPDWVLHAAGMTNVDACEANPEQAYRDNEISLCHLTDALPRECHLLMFSTDQVYPDVEGLHKEDSASPINIYGMSKLAGEKAALSHTKTVVLRTNFFGQSLTENRLSLDDFIIQSLLRKEKITLFSDVLFSPLHMTTLSTLTINLLEQGIVGLFNAGCRGGVSKAKFGVDIARKFSIQTETAEIGLSTSIANRALRTKDLRMNVSKLEKTTGVLMPYLAEEISKL